MSSWTFTCYECVGPPPAHLMFYRIPIFFLPTSQYILNVHNDSALNFTLPLSTSAHAPHYSAEWLPTAYIMICSISMKWNVSHSQKLILHCMWEGLNLECGRQKEESLQCSCHTWNTDWEVELNDRMTGTLQVWIKWKAPSRVQNSTQECSLSMSHDAAVTLVWYTVCVCFSTTDCISDSHLSLLKRVWCTALGSQCLWSWW